MKSKFLLLLKIQLYGFAGINRILYSKNPREKQNSILIGAGILSILVLLVCYSALTSLGIARMGMSHTLPAITVLLSSMITLFFTFLKSTGALIGLRDYDLTMSLPVKSCQVVLSRLSVIYLTNLAVSLIVVLPAIVIYRIYDRAETVGYIIFLLSLLLIPVIPMVFALGIGILITAVSSHSRHKNMVTLFLAIITVLVIVFGGAQLNNINASQMADIGLALSSLANRIYPPAAMVSSAVTDGSWLQFLVFAVFSAATGVIFTGTVSHFYKRLNTSAFSQRTQAAYTKNVLKANTPVRALYKREFCRYFSCTIYVLNSSIGMIFLLVMAILLQFLSPEALEQRIGMTEVWETMRKVLPMVPAVLISMSCTTSASLSLEGKNRWIMCSAPVRAIDIFHSKIAVNLTVILPIAFISSILLGSRMQVSLLNFLFLFLIPVIYAFFISVLGMILNVKFPVYDWTSEYYAVKGVSVSVLATSVIGLLSSILPLLLCIALPSFSNVTMGVVLVALAFITKLLYGKLCTYHLYVL